MPRGLACSECDTAAILRRRICDLEEEVRAYQARERDDARAMATLERITVIRERLKVAPAVARLLLYLTEHAGKVRSKEQLLRAVSDGEDVEIKVVDVQICHLRRALKRVGARVALETVWGDGYRLTLAEAAEVRQRLASPAPELANAAPALPPPSPPARPAGPPPIRPDQLGFLQSRMSDGAVAAILGKSLAWVKLRREHLTQAEVA